MENIHEQKIVYTHTNTHIERIHCMGRIHPYGRHLENCSTIELKWSHSFLVSYVHIILLIDEVKWGVRQPSRYAMSDLTLNYLDKVQLEVNTFLRDRIKHDFLKPDRELTLDLTVREAEILMTANPDVRALAEKGDLKAIHDRLRASEEKVEADFLKVRDLIDRIIQQVEEKENEIYEQLEDAGIQKLRRHGSSGGILDTLGLSSGNASIGNLNTIEAAMQNNEQAREQLRHIQQKLHSYIGVKYSALDAKADVYNDFIGKVAKGDKFYD